MRPSRCGMMLIALWGLLATDRGELLAGPPKIGEPNPLVQWLQPLNPANWQMPTVNWPGQEKPGPVLRKKKPDGIWSGVTGTLGKGWQATKRTLDPARWLPPSQPARSGSQGRIAEKQPGFWSGLWPARDERKKIKTANDFLSQPVPY